MTDTTDGLNAAHPDGGITLCETSLQAGLRAVREMPDDLSVEEHLRNELQAAHDNVLALEEENRALLERLTWNPIETAPKVGFVDILIDGTTRWCDCYHDSITNEWRTSRPSGHLAFVKGRSVTHWMYRPDQVQS